LGGIPLFDGDEPLPKFYDAVFGCEMEIVAYDSRQPAVRYSGLVDQICEWLRVRHFSTIEIATNGLRMTPVASAAF
jgi:hypothetical protein